MGTEETRFGTFDAGTGVLRVRTRQRVYSARVGAIYKSRNPRVTKHDAVFLGIIGDPSHVTLVRVRVLNGGKTAEKPIQLRTLLHAYDLEREALKPQPLPPKPKPKKEAAVTVEAIALVDLRDAVVAIDNKLTTFVAAQTETNRLLGLLLERWA